MTDIIQTRNSGICFGA